MRSPRLLEYFDRISDAAGALPGLRRFILDLAVRGKLVDQDPNDEPASELLKRLDKKRLEHRAKSQQLGRTQLVEVERAPHRLPESWQWVRLETIVQFSAGRTPSRTDLGFWNTGDYAWVSIADMKDGGTIVRTKETVSERARGEVFRSPPAAVGTLIMSFKLTIGKIARLGIPAFHNEAIISIGPHLPEFDSYLFKVLPQLSRQGETKDAIKGATLNRDSIAGILIPLPPLAEQGRIVAKIDELMGLCDRLEAAQAEREQRRDLLLAASLGRLSRPKNGEDATFQQHVSFHLNQLPRLTTRLEHIVALRQSILDLAIRGRLVRQSARDEPAAELLKRLQAAKAQQSTSRGRVRKDPQLQVSDDDIPFQLPHGWAWSRWRMIARNIGDIDHQMPESVTTGGIPYVSPRDFLPGNKINFDGAKRVSHADYVRLSAKIRPTIGDLIYPRYGTIGETRLVEDPREFLVSYSCAIIQPMNGFVDPRFQYYFSLSQLCKEQAKVAENKTTQANVGIKSIQGFIVPIPPFAEQRRIVAKVDELMTCCDQLEVDLTTAQLQSGRLLKAVVHEAIEGTS